MSSQTQQSRARLRWRSDAENRVPVNSTEAMIVARRMVDDFALVLIKMSQTFQNEPANADRMALLDSDPADRIYTERLSRLLEQDEWDQADLFDLSSLFFLMGTMSDEEEEGARDGD